MPVAGPPWRRGGIVRDVYVDPGYVERYDLDGECVWLPRCHPSGALRLSRGQATAAGAQMLGGDFTEVRTTVAWMRRDPELTGHDDDMMWQCEVGAPGSYPYWRVELGP